MELDEDGPVEPPPVEIVESPVDEQCTINAQLTLTCQARNATHGVDFFIAGRRHDTFAHNATYSAYADGVFRLVVTSVEPWMLEARSSVVAMGSRTVAMAAFQLRKAPDPNASPQIPVVRIPSVSRRYLASGMAILPIVIGWAFWAELCNLARPTYANSCGVDGTTLVVLVAELWSPGLLDEFRPSSPAPAFFDAVLEILYGNGTADENAVKGVAKVRAEAASAVGIQASATGVVDLMGHADGYTNAFFPPERSAVIQRLRCPRPGCPHQSAAARPMDRLLFDDDADMEALRAQWTPDAAPLDGDRLCQCKTRMVTAGLDFRCGAYPLVYPVEVGFGSLGWSLRQEKGQATGQVRGCVSATELGASLARLFPELRVGTKTYRLGGIILSSFAKAHYTVLIPARNLRQHWVLYDGKERKNRDRLHQVFELTDSEALEAAAKELRQGAYVPALVLYVAEPSVAEPEHAGWAAAVGLEPDDEGKMDPVEADEAVARRIQDQFDAAVLPLSAPLFVSRPPPQPPTVTQPGPPPTISAAFPAPPGNIFMGSPDAREEPEVTAAKLLGQTPPQLDPTVRRLRFGPVETRRALSGELEAFKIRRLLRIKDGQPEYSDKTHFLDPEAHPRGARLTVGYRIWNEHELFMVYVVVLTDPTHYELSGRQGPVTGPVVVLPHKTSAFVVTRLPHQVPQTPPSMDVFYAFAEETEARQLTTADLTAAGRLDVGVTSQSFFQPPRQGNFSPATARKTALAQAAASQLSVQTTPPANSLFPPAPPTTAALPGPMTMSSQHEADRVVATHCAARLKAISPWDVFRRGQLRVPIGQARTQCPFSSRLNGRLRVAVGVDLFGIRVTAVANAANATLRLEGVSGVTRRLAEVDNPYQRQWVDAHVPSLDGRLGVRGAPKLQCGGCIVTRLHKTAANVCLNILAPSAIVAEERRRAFELQYRGVLRGLEAAVEASGEGGRATVALPLLGCGAFLGQFDSPAMRATLLSGLFAAIRAGLEQLPGLEAVVVAVHDLGWVEDVARHGEPFFPLADALPCLGGDAYLGLTSLTVPSSETPEEYAVPIHAVGGARVAFHVTAKDFQVKASRGIATPGIWDTPPSFTVPARHPPGSYMVSVLARPLAATEAADGVTYPLNRVDPLTSFFDIPVIVTKPPSRKRPLEQEVDVHDTIT